jgi:single-strand DNA-binding protein
MRMDAATVTIVGRAVTNPVLTTSVAADRATFRVVSTERRLDQATKEWIDGDEFGVGVVCWRHLAQRVADSIRVGDPIVVIGRISTRKYERSDGSFDYFTDVRADLVAVDVSKMGGRFVRGRHSVEPGGQARSADARPVDVPAEPAFGHSGTAGAGVASPAEPADDAPDALMVESHTAAGPVAGSGATPSEDPFDDRPGEQGSMPADPSFDLPWESRPREPVGS